MRFVRSVALATTLLLALTACSRPATPRVEGPLAVDISELCTQCIETLACEGDGRRTTYVLDEKSFWAQIATIWDYLIQHVRPRTEDFRIVTVYEFPGGNATAMPVATSGSRARLDVWNRRVELPGAVIIQRSGAWQDAAGRVLGTCRALPPQEARKTARELAARARGTSP